MKWLDRIADLGVVLAIVALVFMMVHVSLDIVFKRIGLGPITGTLEIVSIYYMVGCIFLPMMNVQRQKGHIFVELVSDRFSPRVVRALDFFASLVTLAFALGLAYMGAAEALEQTLIREKSEAATLSIEVWPSRWFVVFGACGMTLYLLLQIGKEIKGMLRPPHITKSDR
ncbi:MAG: transporter small permease [Deltaproteobacteria bacterium]|jgi:TRAP-type C4-dicarboxylate transport system permease small subunit|nr:transporter small permease [Deltaproteobacteria bacterium]